MQLTYLASPYTHPNPWVREQRYMQVCAIAARLMKAGEVVFCPIAHSHPIDLKFERPESGEFWKAQDAPYLEFCTDFKVARLDGWQDSKGVQHEIEVAMRRGLTVKFIDP